MCQIKAEANAKALKSELDTCEEEEKDSVLSEKRRTGWGEEAHHAQPRCRCKDYRVTLTYSKRHGEASCMLCPWSKIRSKSDLCPEFPRSCPLERQLLGVRMEKLHTQLDTIAIPRPEPTAA